MLGVELGLGRFLNPSAPVDVPKEQIACALALIPRAPCADWCRASFARPGNADADSGHIALPAQT